jgi:putative flippase GtrA
MINKINNVKTRFILVGVLNTAVDFSIFSILIHGSLGPLPANYISTSVAMIISFAMSRFFTFRSKNKNIKTQFLGFAVTTGVGVWAIQPIILFIIQILFGSSFMIAIFGKCVATGASLIWNYVVYSKIIFKN